MTHEELERMKCLLLETEEKTMVQIPMSTLRMMLNHMMWLRDEAHDMQVECQKLKRLHGRNKEDE
jgi:lysophospholipid acyltransferase (LPLAT)-like uncharacterized protein